MANVAGPRSLRSFFYVMRDSVPIIRQEIEILHLDADGLKGIPDGRNYPQSCDRFLIAGIETQDKAGF